MPIADNRRKQMEVGLLLPDPALDSGADTDPEGEDPPDAGPAGAAGGAA